ncbi:unnamed protein product (mitochondrion) [Plasmodiophora brassicae]|uniref:RING-type domain-containing protein n=1 Tax=Plasmodiophora brassicae TaxID=37360 RepID=A0A3P3Y3K8_PLABS|nr:unnamed protein product [Plasmodiophora brassicae]
MSFSWLGHCWHGTGRASVCVFTWRVNFFSEKVFEHMLHVNAMLATKFDAKQSSTRNTYIVGHNSVPDNGPDFLNHKVQLFAVLALVTLQEASKQGAVIEWIHRGKTSSILPMLADALGYAASDGLVVSLAMAIPQVISSPLPASSAATYVTPTDSVKAANIGIKCCAGGAQMPAFDVTITSLLQSSTLPSAAATDLFMARQDHHVELRKFADACRAAHIDFRPLTFKSTGGAMPTEQSTLEIWRFNGHPLRALIRIYRRYLNALGTSEERGRNLLEAAAVAMDNVTAAELEEWFAVWQDLGTPPRTRGPSPASSESNHIGLGRWALPPADMITQVCAICLHDFADAVSQAVDVPAFDNDGKVPEVATIRSLPCGHIFHDNCIREWFNTDHHICPYCRQQVPRRQLGSQNPST